MRGVTGINHITLAVRNPEKSCTFYRDVLGCRVLHQWEQGVYLLAGDIWLCLSYDENRNTEWTNDDYTHIAFSVEADDFSMVKKQILESGAQIWKENKSEGESLYFLDPDGHKLELHVGDAYTRLAAWGIEAS